MVLFQENCLYIEKKKVLIYVLRYVFMFPVVCVCVYVYLRASWIHRKLQQTRPRWRCLHHYSNIMRGKWWFCGLVPYAYYWRWSSIGDGRTSPVIIVHETCSPSPWWRFLPAEEGEFDGEGSGGCTSLKLCWWQWSSCCVDNFRNILMLFFASDSEF